MSLFLLKDLIFSCSGTLDINHQSRFRGAAQLSIQTVVLRTYYDYVPIRATLSIPAGVSTSSLLMRCTVSVQS